MKVFPDAKQLVQEEAARSGRNENHIASVCIRAVLGLPADIRNTLMSSGDAKPAELVEILRQSLGQQQDRGMGGGRRSATGG